MSSPQTCRVSFLRATWAFSHSRQGAGNGTHGISNTLSSYCYLPFSFGFWGGVFCCCCLGFFKSLTTQAIWQCKPGWFSKATFSFLFFNVSQPIRQKYFSNQHSSFNRKLIKTPFENKIKPSDKALVDLHSVCHGGCLEEAACVCADCWPSLNSTPAWQVSDVHLKERSSACKTQLLLIILNDIF